MVPLSHISTPGKCEKTVPRYKYQVRNVDFIDDVIRSTQLNNTASCHQAHVKIVNRLQRVSIFLAQISSDESEPSLNDAVSTVNVEDADREEDYGIIRLGANAPYWGEPQAVLGQRPANRLNEDKDGISIDIIEARFERRVNVDSW